VTNPTSVYYSADELSDLGIASVGAACQIDRSVRFFAPHRIRIGSHVRIDPFCLISGPSGNAETEIVIGDYVHLSVGCTLSGRGGITIDDYCGLSVHVSIFSSNDDYSGGFMTGPLVPSELTRVRSAPVRLDKHVIVGCNSVILPGTHLAVGASVGALTLVNKSVPEFTIVSGNPMRKIGLRSRQLLDLEQQINKANTEQPNH
jgi:acetyltransferase-like isoleucine patch superfamily enzyme